MNQPSLRPRRGLQCLCQKHKEWTTRKRLCHQTTSLCLFLSFGLRAQGKGCCHGCKKQTITWNFNRCQFIFFGLKKGDIGAGVTFVSWNIPNYYSELCFSTYFQQESVGQKVQSLNKNIFVTICPNIVKFDCCLNCREFLQRDYLRSLTRAHLASDLPSHTCLARPLWNNLLEILKSLRHASLECPHLFFLRSLTSMSQAGILRPWHEKSQTVDMDLCWLGFSCPAHSVGRMMRCRENFWRKKTKQKNHCETSTGQCVTRGKKEKFENNFSNF